jgi:hypothetical protein
MVNGVNLRLDIGLKLANSSRSREGFFSLGDRKAVVIEVGTLQFLRLRLINFVNSIEVLQQEYDPRYRAS